MAKNYHPSYLKETQHLTVETSFKEADSGKIMTKYDYQPSVGTHFMKFNRTWVKVERTRENRVRKKNDSTENLSCTNDVVFKKRLRTEIFKSSQDTTFFSKFDVKLGRVNKSACGFGVSF